MNAATTTPAPTFSGRRLAEHRRAAGLRQLDVAAALGRDRRHYQRIEAGHVAPTVAMLGMLATVLGVRIDALYDWPGDTEAVATPT